MDIAFQSKSLRDICESERSLRDQFGEQVADSVKHRLADLRAATTIKDIFVGNPRELSGNNSNCVCIDLAAGFRLMLTSNHVKASHDEICDTNWAEFTRVKILSIGNENV